MSVNYTVYDVRTGEILRYGQCDAASYHAQVRNEHEGIVPKAVPDDAYIINVKTGRANKKPRSRTTSPDEMLRAERDGYLAASDWTQLPDAPVDQAAWAEYRQALRDLPDNTDPINPVWPNPPK